MIAFSTPARRADLHTLGSTGLRSWSFTAVYSKKICGVKKNCMSYPSSRVLVYDLLSLLSLRLRGTRSRNKRACLLRFEKGDLSYLSLRRTPVVGTLAPASSGLKDPVPGALSPHAPRCGARTGFPTGTRENPLHRSSVVADLASPRRSIPPGTRKGVIGRMWRCFGWGCLLVILGAEMSGGVDSKNPGGGCVSGALLSLVASRAVCVGHSGLWRNYG